LSVEKTQTNTLPVRLVSQSRTVAQPVYICLIISDTQMKTALNSVINLMENTKWNIFTEHAENVDN